MIGVFDSGLGGLTVLRALVDRFPNSPFLYLGDHAHVPYGDRSSDEIIDLTRACVEALFGQGCKLVLLGCNTATAVAARHLQQNWLPTSEWRGRNVLGIVAPTVEAATQTPWAVSAPAVSAEVQHRPHCRVRNDAHHHLGRLSRGDPQALPARHRRAADLLASLPAPSKRRRPRRNSRRLVEEGVRGLLAQTNGVPPHRAILGCTHFPLVEHLFRRHLPPFTRILSQPDVVADSLEDYLARHQHYLAGDRGRR